MHNLLPGGVLEIYSLSSHLRDIACSNDKNRGWTTVHSAIFVSQTVTQTLNTVLNVSEAIVPEVRAKVFIMRM